MNRTFKSLLLLFSLLPMLLLIGGGCASPSCEDLTQHLSRCSTQLVNDYGLKTDKRCVPGQKKACSGGQICLQPKNAALAHCYITQEVNKNFGSLVNATSRSCGTIFAAHHKDYLNCVVASESRCDLDKINACASKHLKPTAVIGGKGKGGTVNYIFGLILIIVLGFLLRMVLRPAGLNIFALGKPSLKDLLLNFIFALVLLPILFIEGDIGKFLFGLPIFVGIAIVLEGVLVFVGLKVSDKSNPKNSIMSAILFGALIGLLTYPWVYGLPLPGLFVTSSLLFGLLIVIYHQDVSFSTAFTLLHMIWVWGFFTHFAAHNNIGGEAWFIQKQIFKQEVRKEHKELVKSVAQAKKDKEREEEAKLRAKEEAEKAKKEKAEESKLKAAEKKKKAEEAKKPKPPPTNNRRRRRRRRR